MLLWSAVAVWSVIQLYICFTSILVLFGHSIGRIAYADLLIRNRVPCPIELHQLIHRNSQATRSSSARPPVARFTLSRGILAGAPSRIVARTYLHDNGARGWGCDHIFGGAVISSRAQRRDETLDIST